MVKGSIAPGGPKPTRGKIIPTIGSGGIVAKSNPKKAKAKISKKSTQAKEPKKQEQDAKVLAELELRDSELEAVTGGAVGGFGDSLNTTNTTNTTNISRPNPI